MHDLTIITILAGALAIALLFGLFTQRFGLSPLVGYLIAGIIVGPHTPGFVADAQIASQLAEIGVILLMFGVGLHFHPEELLRVWRVAVPGAVAQSAAATLFGWAIALAFGWSHISGLVFGMSLAVASTVVLMRMLSDQNRLYSTDGHVAVGWLIVEDLFTVIALVVLPALATTGGGAPDPDIGLGILTALGKVVVFAILIWILGPRIVSPLLEKIAHLRVPELFTLTVFVLALSIASVAASVFHVSVALGAFFGGLVVAQSRVGTQAAVDMLPFRDVFSTLFFVSVGMLLDPFFVIDHPGITLAALGIIFIIKPLVALALVLILKHPLSTALTVAVGLAQIGEFSFILAGLGLSLGLLPQIAFDLVVTGALISIAVNPLLFKAMPLLEKWCSALEPSATAAPIPEQPNNDLSLQRADLIIIGYGRTGRLLSEMLLKDKSNFIVIDKDLEQIEIAESRGINALFGDAGNPQLLQAAQIETARVLVLSGELADKVRICAAGRHANPDVKIVSRAASPGEKTWLEEFGVNLIIEEPAEIASALHRALKKI